MDKRESFDNGILSIRFTGAGLSTHGVSIYDLGETLLAIQRVIHKGYLARDGRLEKGAFPRRAERTELALQLGERRRQSDAFALVPLLTDPMTWQALRVVADYVCSGIVGYYTGSVLDQISKARNDPNKQLYIGAIYSEVTNIVNRIDAAGGVEAIAIGSPALQRETVAVFDNDTKTYLSQLKNEVYLGKQLEIRGQVYRLYPNSKIVTIRRAGGKTVNVHLKDTDFDEIRFNNSGDESFSFSGRPMYRFGIESRVITEFSADSIARLEPDEE